MSRRHSEGNLFVGRLSKNCRARDLEDVFEPYGRMARCELKYGAEMAYAFVDYEDRRDAEDAIRYENGREVAGSAIIVEWAKGAPRRTGRDEGRDGGGGGGGGGRDFRDNRGRGEMRDSGRSRGGDECYRCHKSGHWARDCPDDSHYGFRRPNQRDRSPRGRRSRSRSRDRKSRSYSRERRRDRRSRSRSDDKKSRSGSKSRSRSRSAEGQVINGEVEKAGSRSRSASAERAKSASPS